MKDQLDKLLEIQEIDSQIDLLADMVGGFPEELERIDAELAAKEAETSRREAGLAGLKKDCRALEADILTAESGIKKKDATLMSVKNNKEYTAILKEIEEAGVKNSEMEDRLIALLDEIEMEERETRSAREGAVLFKKRKEGEKNDIRAKMEKAENELAKLRNRHAEKTDGVDPALLKQYTAAKGNGGRGVVAIEDCICQGCNLKIPPQKYNELIQFQGLESCPHCKRIIYSISPEPQ